MKNQFATTKKRTIIISGIAILIGLYLISRYSFLLFHSLAEMFSIIVACCIFIVAWNTRRFMDSNYLLFLGIAYLFIAGLDLVHTLGYKGMGVFQSYGANLPTQLWIASRYVEGISLLIASFLLKRKIKVSYIIFGYSVATSVLLISIFLKFFPDCFVEGTGLTEFKKVSEYVISLILIGSIALLFQKRQEFDETVFKLVILSIIFTITAELSFTFYISVYGFSNLIGHYFKLVSFYLIYKAIIETGLVKPYSLLFRKLKQAHHELELRVEERTAELTEANKLLNQEIKEHQQTEDELERSERFLKATGQMAQVGGWELIPDTLEVRWTEETYRIHEVPLNYQPKLDEANNFFHEEDRPKLEQAMQMALEKGESFDMKIRFNSAKDRQLWVHTICKPQVADGKTVKLIGTLQDITEQKNLETQLLQSQKMEAIGKLSGGVAHDFNNLLTVIIGNVDILLIKLKKDSPFKEFMVEIRKASDRAASLTRQLLAFSRKQVLEPKVLSLNAVIVDMEKMLRRLIGEDVDLMTVLSNELSNVEADPGQVEQVIMNLCVNARDAMPQGGKITIETADVELDESYTHTHGTVIPGSYVMMAISDDGAGMDKDTQSRIFDPFFTTKEMGKGTGLGLSTVYGIVKQSEGNIWVYSEPGMGTSFKIYLPKVEKSAEKISKTKQPVQSLTGTETILVVEDDDMVRKLARRVLKEYGYKVLVANRGKEALKICEENKTPIHLMLTDVVMPEMSGPKLAGHLKDLRPEIKVLYMSGYTDATIVHRGILDKGMNFIQKPFTPEALATKVREMVEEK